MPNKKAINWRGEFNSKPEYYYKDVWDGRELGVNVRPYDKYIIDFSPIAQPWLKELACASYLVHT